MAGKGAPREPILINQSALLRMFGIHRNHIKAKQVQPVSGTLYDLNVIMQACDEYAYKFLTAKFASADKTGELRSAAIMKAEKTAQEVRKLTVENDVREGKLVPLDDVYTTYAKNVKVMTDRLDAIPSRVKVAVPDVSQQTLDAIQQVLVEVRNSSARATFSDGLEEL